MRILIYGINFSPELTGIGKYTGELAEWLAARGHDLRVITAPPYYPQWRIGDGYSAWRYSTETIEVRARAEANGVPGSSYFAVYRCPLWIPGKVRGLSRLLHLISFALSSIPVMYRQMFWRPHIVLVIAPALVCAPVAWSVARLSRARAWLHIQDFEIDAAIGLGMLRVGKLRGLVTFCEKWLLRRFDRVSTISRLMVDQLLRKGVEPTRTLVFANWVETDEIYPLERSLGVSKEFGVAPDSIVVLYSGNLGEKQGIEILLAAARILSGEQGITFVICGDGAAKDRLISLSADLGNVMWLPLQPMSALNRLLSLADIHVLPQRAEAADLVMPSKLTGMLASGRPVVATASAGTEVAEAVAGCGFVVAPGDLCGIVDAIRMLARDPQKRRELGAAARQRAIACFDKAAILRAFEQQALKILSAR